MSKFKGKVQLLNQKTICSGFIKVEKLTLKHTLFEGGWSKALDREVALSTHVIGVLLFDPVTDKVLLTEQFRAGAYLADEENAWLTEIVAGRVDINETPVTAAYRESEEETGCTVTKLIPIVNYYPSPGACSEIMQLYCGFFSSSESDGRICGVAEEGEDIRTCLLSVDEIFQRLIDRKINNAATLIALQWLQINHASLKASLHGT